MRNPAKLLHLKREWEGFCERHPKFLRYLGYLSDHYLSEGAVMDITVTDAAGKSIHGNARLSAEDVAFLQEIRSALSGDDR